MPHTRWSYLFIAVILVIGFGWPAVSAEKPEKKSEQQKLLERYARDSLRRLKHAAKSEGFFNARAALNVWKSNAIDAGIYDESLYDQFKRIIYEKSIEENLKWFEIFALQKDFKDAGVCLQFYRLHAEEIGLFDEEKYEEMKTRIKK